MIKSSIYFIYTVHRQHQSFSLTLIGRCGITWLMQNCARLIGPRDTVTSWIIKLLDNFSTRRDKRVFMLATRPAEADWVVKTHCPVIQKRQLQNLPPKGSTANRSCCSCSPLNAFDRKLDWQTKTSPIYSSRQLRKGRHKNKTPWDASAISPCLNSFEAFDGRLDWHTKPLTQIIDKIIHNKSSSVWAHWNSALRQNKWCCASFQSV